MAFWDTLFGYGDEADTYAANVTAQWRILRDTYTNPPTPQWQAFYESFVRNYGPPAATESEQRTRSRDFYINGINRAASDGFIQGVKEAPGIITGAIVDTAGQVWGTIPAWVRWLGIGALVIASVHVLTKADILGKNSPILHRKKRQK
jgi:hypothetical protein